MNVLYVLNSTSTTGGGTKSLLALLDGVMKKGVTPHVIVPDGGDLCDTFKSMGIRYTVLRYASAIYPPTSGLKDKLLLPLRIVRWKLWEAAAVRQVTEYCKKESIDIIHTNVSVISVGLLAAKALGIPHVMHFREYADIDFGLRYFPSKKRYYSMLDYSKSYSVSITKGIRDYHNQNGEHARLIYNGIAFEDCKGQNEYEEADYFLFAGRIEETKGVRQVIEAFDTLHRNGAKAKLLIAGDVWDVAYQKSLEAYVSEHNLTEDVIFLGGRKDIMQLMKSALAIVVSSNFEAFGRCLPEAMLCNCLTIGRNTAGTKEQYDNGLAMWHEEIGLRYSTTEELAKQMAKVYVSPAGTFDRMKSNARKTVLTLYNTEQYVEQVHSFYTEILNKEQI